MNLSPVSKFLVQKNPKFGVLFTELVIGCGGRIWTDGLRVMSPTSYQAAPPRVRNMARIIVI